jgi:hypothetical protein
MSFNAKTDDSILMRRHRDPMLEPIDGRHYESRIIRFDDVQVNAPLWLKLFILGVSILIVGAMVAAALPLPHY